MTVQCHRCGEEWPRDPALEVPCPSCPAGIGQWCRRPSGHRAANLHAGRDRAAMAAGLLKPCAGARLSAEATEQGAQTVLPGAERIAERALAERRQAAPLRAAARQQPADFGLFDVAGRGQRDLFSGKG